MRAVVPLLALTLMAGCAQAPKPIEFGTFPVSEYQALPKTGTSTIAGQIFMKTRGGDVKYGAGTEVVLVPVTSYTTPLLEAYQQDRPITAPDPRVKEYSRRMLTDGTGSFRFEKVPGGSYYVIGSVSWEAPTQWGLSKQGGHLLSPVTVEEGQEARVIVTK
ncbi:hypothetical protein SA496_14330 [Pseudomonas sp. JS3066]|jgi:hypothetical protein|uniref:hypothetical protein n=1 Tax=Pseudomonas sp. JS3066 TaxID=3090665 RepID=UPI002E7B4955|nr:hypothetical protein [Pseudomonas sp. JS3066]WVK90922.1 hypothetical protein SA496_14330 [Pseudomonas sp. JS3066]